MAEEETCKCQRDGRILRWKCEVCDTSCQCPVDAVIASCSGDNCLRSWWVEQFLEGERIK